MKVGVIGTGRMGRLHTSHLIMHDGVGEIWVYDPMLDKAWAKALNLHVADSLDDLLKAPLDAVMITSPSQKHCAHIQQAARAKKHIFCEKPIGLSIDEIEKTIALCQASDVILQVGFNRRFDNGVRELKQNIPTSIGTPHVVKITSRDPEPPSKTYLASCGHLFMDMTIHDFDMARFVAESEVTELYAQGSCLVGPSGDSVKETDTAVVQLRFENGAMGVIDNSRKAVYGYDQRIEVFSNKGTLKTENIFKNEVKAFKETGLSQSALKSFFIDRYADTYKVQLDSFISAVKYKKAPLVNGLDGLQSVKLALAAIQSLSEKRVVKLKQINHQEVMVQKNSQEKAYV